MKDLFEDLNKAVPSNGGAKASKWEILTKGETPQPPRNAYHLLIVVPAIDHIRNSQHQEQRLQHEVSRLQREVDYTRDAQKENDMLKTEVQVMYHHLRRLDPSNPHVYGHFTGQLSQNQSQHGGQPNGTSGVSLPPLNPPGSSNGGHGHGAPGYGNGPAGAMQGVEYGYGGR